MVTKFKVGDRCVFSHHYGFRSGEAFTITKIKNVLVKNSKRLCYFIRFDDGVTDYTPVKDGGGYGLVLESIFRDEVEKWHKMASQGIKVYDELIKENEKFRDEVIN